ncbi:MAG: nucleoside deaminase [Desulfovibrio sp.]|nr:nucleoside deaminase [Desulfovibrio sp.]
MELALQEAQKAFDSFEVPVGAVLVDVSGQILGRGHNTPRTDCDTTAHAEINALRMACRRLANYRLPGRIMVVTLEPCAMCASAILQARLSGLVFGAYDRLCGAVSSAAEYFDPPCAPASAPWHMGGVLADSCQTILKEFFVGRRENE